MATTEKYTTVIELNSEQAKRQLDELKRKVESWKQLKDEAIKAKEGKSFVAQINRELRAAEKELKKYDNEVSRTIDTLNDLGSASIERIEDAQKHLRRMIAEVPHDSGFYQQLNEQLDQVTQELENIKATKAFEKMMQDAAGTTKTFEQIRAEAEFVRQTVENIDTASLKQLKLAEQTAKGIKESAQQGTAEYNGAATSLDKIRAKLTEVETNERKVVSLVERYNQELKNTNKAEQQVVTDTELIDRTLSKLSSASVRDIEYSIKMLNEQLHDTERTGGNVEELTGKLKKLNEELKKVQDMQKPDTKKGNIFSRGVNFLNTNWGAITQIISAITGLSSTIRNAVSDFAAMEEEMADVRKYTGLSADQVRELNEELKRIDTRTSREQLNQLAGAAGRLGIQSKEEILGFVKAADMIGVALGDDLGEGAVDKIGKLAMAFGEDERMGLQKAMVATGSALNELAQNSSAQAGYLVDFTARVAGFGKQIGLTQAEIMGFGAVMDENLLRDEMAATAFGNMLTKMQTDTEKFARIAGKSMQEFTELLNNDANDAILALADSLKMADPQSMMKMLDDMGLDGSRAVGVLATLADKIDDVRKHQQRATEAYEAATSVVNEFSTMNNTVQARLDKSKKAFKEMSVELGEKLLPVVQYTISGAGLLAKTLSVLIDFFAKTKGTIIGTGLAIAGLTIYRKWDVVWEKIQYVWNEKVVKSLRNMLTALKAIGTFIKTNPWAAAIAAVVALAGVVYDLTRKTDDLSDAAKRLKRITEEARRDIADEKAELDSLVATAKDKALTDDVRREAIKKLQQKYPDYLGKLSLEKIYTEQATTAIDKLTESLMAEAKARILVQRIKEAEEEKAALNENFFSGISGLWNSLTATFAAMANTVADGSERVLHALQGLSTGGFGGWNEPTWIEENGYSTDPVEIQLNRYRDAVAEVDEELAGLNEELGNTVRLQAELSAQNPLGDGTDVPPVVPTVPYKTEEELKKEESELKALQKAAEESAKAENDAKIAAKTHEYAMGLIAYRQYIQDMAALRKEGLEKRRDVYERGTAEYEKLNRQVQELNFKGDQQLNQMKLEDMQRCMLRMQMEIEAQAAREEITEEEKQERLRLLDETFLADKVELYKVGTLERMNAEWELEQTEQRNRIERERRYYQQLEQAREQLLGLGNERIMQLELDNIKEVYDRMIARGIARETEKQEAILAVKAKYANYQTMAERDQKKGSEMLSVASAAAKQDTDGRSSTALPFVSTIVQYQATMEKLKELYGNDEKNHAAYLAAKQQATSQFCQELAAQMQAAYNTVNQVMSAASSYFSAQQEYETSLVQKKYESQISAAGNNQKKVKNLQEKQQKEEAAIKTKYAKRAAAIQMAQAVAQTAISAINAYSSAAAIPMTGYILAPIAAAMAIAAGMLQIATIKKQQQAQAAGYYEGGFTGGRRYKKEAGVVHEGEFVANHQAVQNPAIMPFLNFLDQAQRNNTVGSLTMQDVSRSMGAGGSTQVVTPIVNVQTDNEELREAVTANREATEMLVQKLDEGIESYTVMDGPNGLYHTLKRYERLISKK